MAVSGIALPLGSDKFYSGSKDGTVRPWDCHTGQCANVINLGDEVGCLICEGPWVFIGMPNVVKAWNIESSSEFILNEPAGQVYCMVVANKMLFAGARDGGIFVWKGNHEAENPFHHVGSLRGHSHTVTCLTVGCNMLYSGSMDNTIITQGCVVLEVYLMWHCPFYSRSNLFILILIGIFSCY
ncbi:zinc finger CCCH domain-containing protein 48-like isoform X3 [Mangifera indica]|uniref:zinc finger CCCH domain-containing protein 48-like isoform X3 n=1 Tax=Mangifera indica TaxID=29780 RepID=UPI001CFA9D02|nr:zinc finger CCCH domain-containing protein 48-like isoform X3 [Mangifera indica]